VKEKRLTAQERRPGVCDFVPEDGAWAWLGSRYHPVLEQCVKAIREAGFESLLEERRLLALMQLSQMAAESLSGELIELGVYKGGGAAAVSWNLARRGIPRAFHLCDTFRGLPKPLEWEVHQEADFDDTSVETVAKRLRQFIPNYPYEFHQGFFSETLPSLAQKTFCFAHVDADLYSSVREACEFLCPRMPRGGIIIFDDYGAPTCPGAKKAVDEFFAGRVEKPTHIAQCSYGVVLGRAEVNFQRLLAARVAPRALLRAAHRLPKRAVGRPAAKILDSLASPTTSKILGAAVGVRSNGSPIGSELKEAGTVLVVRPDGVGDLVLMSPFLRELRKSKKGERIILVVDERFANLVELCPWIDELKRFRATGSGPAQEFRQYWRVLQFARKNLRTGRIDLALLPRWDVDYYQTGAMGYFSGAANRVSYSENVHAGKQYFNHGMDRLLTRALGSDGVKHEVERNLDVLRAVGGTVADSKLELWLSEDDRAKAKRAFADGGVREGEPIIVMAPGAGHAKRMWPLGRFIQLGVQLTKEFGGRIVVVGGREDEERAQRVSGALGERGISVAGQMSLRETAAMLERASLMVTNDSGPMHLAAAAGVPVVEISCHPVNGYELHANSPKRFHPWEERYEVVQPAQAEAPCGSACEWQDAHCILGVSVEMVMNAVLRLQGGTNTEAARGTSEASGG
jgi:ADP-heptose:LPS heptosyltransferase